jgi:hypothetical protein
MSNTVTIHMTATRKREGCAVVVIARDGTSTTVAHGLRFGHAVKIAQRVRGYLDEDDDVGGINRMLRRGEVSA